MSNGVLPALLVLAVVREAVHDELVNAVERDFLVGGVLWMKRDGVGGNGTFMIGVE